MATLGADATFRPLHQALWDKALTANFSAQPFAGIAAHSLRATLAVGRTFDVAP
ncbi:TPA: hypothetical protein ACX37R_000176 [Serratia marcescens]|uniref:hypothetical protein n=1 Tax=Serratia marcescens TaxID=615 RepID=UPI001F06A105|nr:hypothetical protein [Serratia marcescens]MDM1839783.1 hypothetical protein [Serratia marcescens]MDM1846920.1 hypothetical protein [Serratia marcescens]UMK46363.1 hypothetical protein L2D51_14995 [Serratia marcescens]HCU0894081.1 hypothetical protein [Serratia marcescens]HEJ7099045.1 hypothetical protein [Serratia marcescens]